MRTIRKILVSLAAGAGAAFALSAAVHAHHSFAMYDLQRTQVFTGVVTRVDPAPNHLQIFFAPMNDDRKNVVRDEAGEPVVWSVEMQGSSQAAREGISVSSFPRGTVFSVGLHPLRNGDTAGTREGGLFKCPEGTPPAAGMHCDSVDGHVAIGDEGLPASTD
ncbi:MAG TPA: DUF6152 family protein [Gammaproteobacteria bacterium]|nr:DUF6152 family protein [Gammaproteobacteria bacterium]